MTQPIVDSVQTLEQIQAALAKAERNGDSDLKRDAESVLSALVLVLKHRRVKLPAAVAKSLEAIQKCNTGV